MKAFAAEERLVFVKQWDLAVVRRFRHSWRDQGLTVVKKLERLRAVFEFARENGWIQDNPVGDAVRLRRDRIVNGRLFLYTQKTGTPVWCPLPPFVIEALENCDPMNETYYFWSGQSSEDGVARTYMSRLKRIFRLAGIPNGHAHRFRDTFAVELLLAGVPLERVSVLLGHSSIKVTEKHYAPWVRARQEQLERDVRAAWQRDPLALGTGSVAAPSSVQ